MPHADQTTRHLRWTLGARGARGAIALSAYRPIGWHGDYQVTIKPSKTTLDEKWWKCYLGYSWILWIIAICGDLCATVFSTVQSQSLDFSRRQSLAILQHLQPQGPQDPMDISLVLLVTIACWNPFESMDTSIPLRWLSIYIYIYNWITSRRPMLGPQAEI
jgi:hypothetical protein